MRSPLRQLTQRWRSRRFRVFALCALLVLGLLGWLATLVDWLAVRDHLVALDLRWLFLAMALLPLFGFPISVVYIVAGARFGMWWGGVLVAAVTTLHLFFSHAIGRWLLRKKIEHALERRGWRIPHLPRAADAEIAAFGALVPGVPYFIRNYLLALTDVRFVVYWLVCLPVYVGRSYLALMLGGLAARPTTRELVIGGTVEAVKLVVCALILRHLYRRYGRGVSVRNKS